MLWQGHGHQAWAAQRYAVIAIGVRAVGRGQQLSGYPVAGAWSVCHFPARLATAVLRAALVTSVCRTEMYMPSRLRSVSA